MRKIIYWVHTSVDGFIEGPNGEFDWPQLGPDLGQYTRDLHERVDTFLYGRRVWDMMAGYWPNAEEISDHPHDRWFAPIWRATPKIVFSRSLTSADWAERVLGGPGLAEQVGDLKAAPGKDLLLTGGAELAAELTRQGLIDEYQLAVHPVVLGGGRRVLPDTERVPLTHLDTSVYDKGVTVMRYTRQER